MDLVSQIIVEKFIKEFFASSVTQFESALDEAQTTLHLNSFLVSFSSAPHSNEFYLVAAWFAKLTSSFIHVCVLGISISSSDQVSKVYTSLNGVHLIDFPNEDFCNIMFNEESNFERFGSYYFSLALIDGLVKTGSVHVANNMLQLYKYGTVGTPTPVQVSNILNHLANL